MLTFIVLLVWILGVGVGHSNAQAKKSQFITSGNLFVALSGSVSKSIPFGGTSNSLPLANKVTPGSPIFNTTTTVKVVFDSMTVHNTHEGTFSGDGEYDIVAYVQGIKVGLTDLSIGGEGPAFCSGFGCGFGLVDVSKGETVTFKPGAEVTVDLPQGVPLTVFTAGVEVDTCGRKKFPNGDDALPVRLTEPELKPNSLAEVLKHPELNWAGIILVFQDLAQSFAKCIFFTANDNDDIGGMLAFYNPPLYGVGQHNENATNIDFTLRYTITITKPPGGVAQSLSQ